MISILQGFVQACLFPEEIRKSHRMGILIVEDDGLTRLLFQDVLERHGFEVAGIAKNVQQAQQLMNHLKPDVVVLDLMLPMLDGLQLAQTLAHQSVAVVVVTGRDDPLLRAQAMAHGVRAYLLKPLDEWTLIEQLKQIISASSNVQNEAYCTYPVTR